jgi:hypothetical protein
MLSMPHRFQFSLRAAFVILTALGIWLGIAVSPAQQQRRAVKAIEALGGSVAYDWEFREDDSDPAPNGPAWLRRLIGDDYFQTAECVYILGSAEQTLKSIPHLKRLKGVKTLVFGMHSDEAAMSEVAREFPQCEILMAGA